MVQENWLKLTILWIVPNTFCCWRNIWYQTWMKVRYFCIMEFHITDCMQHNRNWLMNVSSHWKIGQIRALSEIIDQMLSRIHQKNPHNLELWELKHREWYLVSEDEGFVCILSKVQWNIYSSYRKPYNILTMCINFLKSTLYKFL